MRTTIGNLVFDARKALGLTMRPYSVEGGIFFRLCSSHDEPDLSAMRQAILDVDAKHPWRDFDHFNNERVPSIKFLSDGRSKIDNWTTPEKTCCFSIFPGIDRLGKGQLHAYEQYLGTLVRELKKRQLRYVEDVWCTLHTCRVITSAA